jgi:hypothetical protein
MMSFLAGVICIVKWDMMCFGPDLYSCPFPFPMGGIRFVSWTLFMISIS